MNLEQITVSPCSMPDLTLEEALKEFSAIGYRQFEVFTSWAKSAVDISRDPEEYLALADKYKMRYTSFHLPPIEDDIDTSLENALKAARFAESLRVEVVLFKAASIENFVKSGKKFLDGIAGIKVIPVVQNHKGTAITTLEDYREVLQGINDARLKALLEVGHFHSVGVTWKKGYELLKNRIALIHIKDQIGEERVPFGKGEVDLIGLFRQMDSDGYQGKYVVEVELDDFENKIRYLSEALEYMKAYIKNSQRSI